MTVSSTILGIGGLAGSGALVAGSMVINCSLHRGCEVPLRPTLPAVYSTWYNERTPTSRLHFPPAPDSSNSTKAFSRGSLEGGAGLRLSLESIGQHNIKIM